MKRLTRMLLSMLLALMLTITMVTPALAATVKITTYNTTHYFQSYANDKWSDLKTPRHAISNNTSLIFYCLQHKKSTPKGQAYTVEDIMGSYGEKTRNGIYSIMLNGYPFNSNGLSKEKAFYATANALRCWLAERGDSQHYNMSKLNDFTASKLRSLAASGTITKKLRVADEANIPMLEFMVELLIMARNQQLIDHNIGLNATDIVLSNNGSSFNGTSNVTIENLRGGYKIDTAALPEGSSVTGYTGTANDTLSISIPVRADTAGQSYNIILTGYDDRVPGNVRAYEATDATYQRVLGIYAGTNYMEAVCSQVLTVTTPSQPMPDLTISSMTTDKGEYSGGEKVKVTATITNQGNAAASAFETAVELEGLSPVQQAYSGLGVGQSVQLNYEFVAPILDAADTLDILGFTDCTGIVQEENETNNDAMTTVNILASQPDLTITSLKADRSSYSGGDTITVKAVVKNIGSRSSGAFDLSLKGTGLSTQTKALSSLDAGSSKTLTFTFTAPSASSGSTIDFLAFADCNDEVAESREDNNTAETSVGINATLPDLTIESVTPNPSTVNQGDSVEITVVVGNRGNKNVSSSDVRLTVGNTLVGTKVTNSVSVGSTATLTFNYTIPDNTPAGVLEVVATVDPANAIQESNESNNTGRSSISVDVKLPDLVMKFVSPDPATTYPGERVEISVVVGNDGDKIAPASDVTLIVGNTVVGSAPMASLAVGKNTLLSFYYTVPASTPEGVLNIIATVDPANAIAEKNENNNTGSNTLRVEARLPDLTVESVTPNPSTTQPGETVEITVVVGNEGDKAVTSSEVTLIVGDVVVGTTPVANVPVGGSQTVTFQYTIPANTPEGRLDIIAIVDSQDVIAEKNENNNVGNAVLDVEVKLPDLTIESVTPNPSKAHPGEKVEIAIVVGNEGEKDVSSSEIAVVIGGQTVGTIPVSNLPAGGTQTIVFTYTVPENMPEGTLNIVATVDPSNTIREEDETNNTGSNSMRIEVKLPDLTIRAVTPDPSTVEAGESVTIAVVVGNDGDKDVPSSDVSLAVGGVNLGAQTAGPIPVGGSTTLHYGYTVPEDMPVGTIDIVATVDPSNFIRERDETNNTGTSAIGVQIILPDLTVIHTNADQWYSALDVVVTVTIRNNTPKAVPSVAVRLIIGNESYEERICVPGSGENLAVFRITVPDVTGSMPISFVVDPGHEIEEMDEDNNNLDHHVEIYPLPSGEVIDPDDSEMQERYESSGLSGMPDLDESTSHSWQEYRYEGGSYVLHDYWAKLELSAEIEPDERVAYEEMPDVTESGFGVSMDARTRLTTNYDHAEKLVSIQRVWCWSPESGYGELSGYEDVFDSLQPREGNRGDKEICWQYAVNPHSETDSRLHYTPLWFPNENYRVLAEAIQAWSPAGEMYAAKSDTVTIDGDMYDRVTAVN